MTNILMRNRANNAQARIPMIQHRRSIFPFQKSRKQTMKGGFLIPIFYEEVLPGDTWEINMTAMVRMMPQIAPPLDNLTISTFFFFDPHRLQWEHFANQHGEKKNPNDTIDYITPKLIMESNGGFPVKSLQDYLGKPVLTPNIETTSLPERMYNRLYNNYFRSEFLQDSIYENDTDKDDKESDFKLKRITKMHDYFTDALPTLQQGDPVQLPLGTSAPVWGISGTSIGLRQTSDNDNSADVVTPGVTDHRLFITSAGGTNSIARIETNNENIAIPGNLSLISKEKGSQYGINSGLYADLSEAVSADISALRLMIQTQEILERDNRNGTRYTEMLQGRYGALNPDLRLGRPQYLGGTRTPFFTTPVVQTSGTGTQGQNTPQGNLAGYGVNRDSGNVVRNSFGEFGAIMGLMAITTTPQYQYGLHRKFTRFERFDYMYPEFMGLSDQAIKNKELYATGGNSDDDVWGYIGRYDEYRYFNNEICGELRSKYPESLEVWTYAENMKELQNLNSNFIEDKTDQIVQRSMAVQSDNSGEIEDQFIVQCEFSGAVTRVLTSKAVPQTGGRIL